MHHKGHIQSLFIVGIIFLHLFVSSCEKELELNLPATPSRLVVEGWIENGQRAEILLSHSAPYFSAIDSNSLLEFAETRAKVTLFSDSEDEILTLKPNQAYFPPLVYKSVEMKGEAGRTYSIEVIYFNENSNGNDTVTATTTIPEPVGLDSVWFKRDAGMDSKGRLWIMLTDNAAEANFYRILYKRKGKDSQYVATNLSTFSDVFYNGKTVEIAFRRGYSSLIELEDDNYFEAGDTVSVKFCTIDKAQFDYWNLYQNKVLASTNPLSTSNYELRSNVKGGLGIWTGYGASYYLVYAK